MYVCICNAYRESHLRNALEGFTPKDTTTVEELYARLGKKLRCGRCLPLAKDVILTSLPVADPQSGISLPAVAD